MALRIRAQFKSERDQIWTIQIHDTEWSAAVNTMDVAPPGFTLAWAGGEDIYHPIIPSTCTVPVYVNSAADDTFIEDLATADEGRFRLVIRKGDGDNASLWWVGILTVDNITLSDEAHPQLFELQAVDGLQLLSRVTYDNQAGSPSVAEVLLYCLNQIGTHDLFVTSGIDLTYLRTVVDVRPVVGSDGDPLDDVKLLPGYWNPSTQSYDFDIDSETVLTQLARCYNARLMLCEGAFHFMPVSTYTNTVGANESLRCYKADGTAQSNQTEQLQFTVNAAASEFYRLRGWERRVIAPVNRVQRPLIYGEGHLIDNTNVGGVALRPSGATVGTTSASYTLSSDNTFPAGTTFSVNGLCSVDVDYLGTGSGSIQCGRLRLAVKLRVGSYYIRRMLTLNDEEYTEVSGDEFNNTTDDENVLAWNEPETMVWSTTSSSRYQWGSDVLNYDKFLPDFVTGQDDSTQITLDFTTPGLPVAQDVDVELEIIPVLFNSNGGDAITAKKNATSVDVTLVLSAGDELNGSTIIYAADNDNGASEVRELDAVNFGSQVVFTSVYYYNPAELYNVNGPLPNWRSDLTSTSLELHELCVIDQAKYFNAPKEIHTGSLYSNDGTVLPFYACAYDGERLKNFMILSMTMHADSETYEIEMHELGQNGSPTSDIVRPRPPKPPVSVQAVDSLTKRINRDTRSTARQFIQVTDDVADIQADVNAITRDPDSSGGQSSIALSDLGDVKVSSPANGQILEYNTIAGRWANVTPTSGTISGIFRGVMFDNSGGGEMIGTGSIDFAIDDVVAILSGYSNTDGVFACNTACTIDRSTVQLTAIQNWQAQSAKFTQIAPRPNLSLSELSSSASTDTFSDSLQSFGLTTSGTTSFTANSIVLVGAIDQTGNLRTSGTLTASGLQYPTSDGTNGQHLTTNGTGTLSWATPSSGAAYPISEIDSTNLVAHWDASNSNSYPFTGATVTDVIGSVTLSLNNGCFWQRVAAVDSFVFDGVNDDLGRGDTPSDLQFQFTDAFTIGLWIKPAFSDTDGFMVFCGNPEASGNFEGISFVNGATNDRLTPRLWMRATGSSFLLCSMNGSLTQNEWQYLVVTYSGSKAVSSVKFYVNGSEVTGTTGTNTGGSTTIAHTGNKYTIGSRDNLNSFYGGQIADCHVYDSALNSTTIASNYTKTRGKFML